MDDERVWLPAIVVGVLVAIGAAWFGTSGMSRARVGAHLDAAASLVPPGTLATATIRTGSTPGSWKPYVPPGAHMGPHRMYHHPKQASPCMTDLMAPDQYDWLFCPPSEGDL